MVRVGGYFLLAFVSFGRHGYGLYEIMSVLVLSSRQKLIDGMTGVLAQGCIFTPGDFSGSFWAGARGACIFPPRLTYLPTYRYPSLG